MTFPVRVRTSTGWQDLALVGPQGAPGPPGAANAIYTGTWRWQASGSASASGQVSDNQPSAWQTATVVYLNELTDAGADASLYLDRIATGDGILLQQKDDSSVYVKFVVTATPTDAGAYRSIPVSLEESAGSAPTNNTPMLVSILKSGSQGGVDLVYEGAYAGSTVYTDGDIVMLNGIAYLCVRSTSAAPTPWEGGRGVPQYIHTQTAPATTWTIQHNLGRYPSVTVVDSGNSEVIPNITYVDQNTVTATFGSATSGKAYVN